MRIIALGDTHGRVNWKEIVEKEKNADKIIFIGDYFDTHGGGVSGNRQIVNFKEILELKRANPEQVQLMTGNHDFHYIRGIGETYSGYQSGYAIDIGAIVGDAIAADLIQMCYQHDKFVFTHAGLTKTWCKANDIDTKNLSQSVNDLFKFKPNKFKFTAGPNFNNYGDDITQPPIWVRPASLHNDILDGVTCVVGHTVQDRMNIHDAIILIDCLGTSGEYLVIENNIPSVAK